MSGYENWIDHTLDRLGMIPHGHTFDLLDEDDLDRYAKRIVEEGVEAVVRTATGGILYASLPQSPGELPTLSCPKDWGFFETVRNFFDPKDRNIDPPHASTYPMIIVDGPSLAAKGTS